MTVASYTLRVMQDGRTVPPPAIHGLILEALKLQPGAKVLEIGTGSGTTARCLARACCTCGCARCHSSVTVGGHTEEMHCGFEACRQGIEVHTVELIPVYGETINPQDPDIYFHAGDGKLGLAQEAPFDAIVATCGVAKVPLTWEQQLKDNGLMVAPVGQPAAQRLVLMTKERGLLRLLKVLAYVRFSMMQEEIT